MSGFFGWQAYRKSDGWYAVKCVARDEYRPVNLVWAKQKLDISKDATRDAAEREIKRMYMMRKLRD